MRTEIDMMLREIRETEESKDFDKAMGLAKYLAWKVIECNAMGRAVERAVVQVCGNEKFTEVTRVALDERMTGDQFTKKEQEFYDEMFTIWD